MSKIKSLIDWYNNEFGSNDVGYSPQQVDRIDIPAQTNNIEEKPKEEEKPSEEIERIEKVAEIQKASLLMDALKDKLQSVSNSLNGGDEIYKDLKKEAKLLLDKISEVVEKI
jgi:hypothetical protein